MMLLNDTRRICLWTPFRCYSTSLHCYVCRDLSWWHFYGHMEGDDPISPHTNVVAPQWDDFEFWLPIRNPYDRAVSMWRYVCHVEGCLPFEVFIFDRLTDPPFAPVTDLYRFDRVIPMECFTEKARDLGIFYGDFPHRHAGADYKYTMTEGIRERIAEIYSVDFDAGGYLR